MNKPFLERFRTESRVRFFKKLAHACVDARVFRRPTFDHQGKTARLF